MSNCLHCDINELVDKWLQQDGADLAELSGKVAESLVDMILLAAPADQTKLMADVLANFGQIYLEKSAAVEGDEPSRRH
jgi:hypothetical protein